MRLIINWLSVLLAVIGFTSCKPKTDDVRPLHYEITPIEHGLSLKLHMPGDNDGETRFLLGTEWADENTPHERFKNIATNTGTQTLEDDALVIKHENGANIILTWELYQQDNRVPEGDPIYFFAPVIRDDYTHLIGYTSLIVPDIDGKVDVEINLQKLHPEFVETLLSPVWSSELPIEADRLLSGFLMSGDIDFAMSANGHIGVGVHDSVNSSALSLLKRLEPVIATLESVWGSGKIDYRVSFQSADPALGSVLSGTAFPGGFAGAVSSDLGEDRLLGFLAHEVAHEWIPIKLGTSEFENSGREPEGYWISEGFTNFFSRKAQYLVGQIDQDGYVEMINEDLKSLYLSPARQFSNEQIGDLFWENPDVERLPYLRGFLIASKWDAEISKHSDGKFGMMDVLKALEKTNAMTQNQQILSASLIISQAQALGAATPQIDVDRFIITGDVFQPPHDMLGSGYELEVVEIRPYDIGFDPEKTLSTGTFSGVAVNSNAYKAGLRNGMKLVEKVSGGGGDMSSDLVLRVKYGNETFTIAYRPVSQTAIEVPQFKRVY